jgi:hypothetical protein
MYKTFILNQEFVLKNKRNGFACICWTFFHLVRIARIGGTCTFPPEGSSSVPEKIKSGCIHWSVLPEIAFSGSEMMQMHCGLPEYRFS